MQRFVLGMIPFLVWLTLAALPASSQSLSGVMDGESSEVEAVTQVSDFAEAMKEAAANGVSIVVVDTSGNVVTQTEAAPKLKDETEGVEGEMSSVLMFQSEADKFRAKLRSRLAAMPASINEVLFILRASSPDGTIWAFVEVLLWSLALFAVGVLFEREVFGKRFARRIVVARIKEAPEGYTEKMPFLAYRFFMGLVGMLSSMAVAYLVGSIVFGAVEDDAIKFTIAVIYLAYAAARIVAGVWRMVLSPYLSQYRIPRFSDKDAKNLHRWICAVSIFDIVSILFGIWLSELGLNYDVYALMTGILALVVTLLNIAMVLVNRVAISNAIRNGKDLIDVSWLLRGVSTLWAPAMIGYVIFAWLNLTYDLVLAKPTPVPLIAGAYTTLMTIMVVYGLINYVIERFFHRSRAIAQLNEQEQAARVAVLSEGEEFQEEMVQRPRNAIRTFEELARRVSGILAFVAGLYAFLVIWGGEQSVVEDSTVSRLQDVIVILFIGYIVFHVFRIWIDSKIEEEQGDEADGEMGDEGSANSSASRLATLLPLFRNFILIVVVVTIGLIVLLEFGINVSPLFAGAGVVGLAVGFGAQSLVRDIFSGAFFLFDDAFRKGEYLDVGGVKGTVERISVRSFQLRHHLGPLHTIPFGEIQFLTNYSRDWVIMKLPLRVTYDTDVEKVRKLIKKLGQELLSDPVIGDNFIQPLKSQGVIEMQDSAMIVRVKFMTKPGDQWLVRKRVFEEIRILFAREGIQFAHREVTVRLADGKVEDLTPAEREKVLGAAQAAIDEGGQEGGAKGGDDR